MAAATPARGVRKCTGLEALALRRALRLGVRRFSEHLGIAVDTISNWEKSKAKRRPDTESHTVFDTAPARAGAATDLRFGTELATLSPPGGTYGSADRCTRLPEVVWELDGG
jgi:transcriptional regulator with XRE-family HTH domain